MLTQLYSRIIIYKNNLLRLRSRIANKKQEINQIRQIYRYKVMIISLRIRRICSKIIHSLINKIINRVKIVELIAAM